MRLAELVRDQTDDIANEWATWARREIASDASLSETELLDHFPALLRELVASLDRGQVEDDGYCEEAQHHARHRLDHKFHLREMVYEYRILRRVIFRRVLEVPTEPPILEDLARMNEALDLATAEAVDCFSSLRESEERAEMERAASFRERFIGIVSHDLRNPLNAISMGAQLMLRSEETAPAVPKLAARILVNTERMIRMISDLLDLTRGRLGGGIPIAPKPVDLGSVAQTAIDTVEAARPDRRIVTEAHGDLEGEWDPDRLGQVMGNLVTNALQHGDPSSPVEVNLEGAGDEVTITVHNAGAPVPPEEQPHLFEAFRRTRTTRPSSGLGLGLFIAGEIVRAHGGRIAVTSTEDQGTTFTVNLPRRSGHVPEEGLRPG